MTIPQQRPGRTFARPRSWPWPWSWSWPWPRLTPGRRLFVVLAVAVGWLLVSPAARAVAATREVFVPPLPGPLVVVHGFDLPSEPWLAGNRGVDLSATTGESVFAVAGGTVVYAGLLAGRGVVSISHGAIRTTYEPVDPAVHAGDVVAAGEVIGRLADTADACGPPGSCLHWGAITASGYVDPMAFLGRPKIRLLPIWATGVNPPAGAVAADPSTAAAPAPRASITAVDGRAAPVAGKARASGIKTTAGAVAAMSTTALALGGFARLRRRGRPT